MRSMGAYLKWLLPAAVVLATVSCGTRAPSTTVPAASVTPGATATRGMTATPDTSAVPGATATRPAAGTAVIFGVVRVGPTCPVDPVYRMCGPRALGNVEVQARSPSDGVLAITRTETDGHYSLRVRPRSYVIVIMPTQAFPRCPHVLVSIRSGGAIRADITCAIAIRRLGPPATNPA
jgi:hypothetical protein